jgi:hypothetical protein
METPIERPRMDVSLRHLASAAMGGRGEVRSRSVVASVLVRSCTDSGWRCVLRL